LEFADIRQSFVFWREADALQLAKADELNLVSAIAGERYEKHNDVLAIVTRGSPGIEGPRPNPIAPHRVS